MNFFYSFLNFTNTNCRQYYNSFVLNEAEQKLWMAEESWRKSKSNASSSGPSSLQDQSYAQRNLRDRIEDMKGRSLALPTASRYGFT